MRDEGGKVSDVEGEEKEPPPNPPLQQTSCLEDFYCSGYYRLRLGSEVFNMQQLAEVLTCPT